MQKPVTKLLSAFLAMAFAAGFLWTAFWMVQREYVIWNGSLLSRQAESLSVSGKTMRNQEAFLELPQLRQLDARDTGMTVAQYEWFRRELPRCQVLWDIPVQGRGYRPDTERLDLQALTEEDLEALAYLPSLKMLDLGQWSDIDRIAALKERYPHCELQYEVQVAGEWWDCDAVSLALQDADAQELSRRLSLFDHLDSVLLTGAIPSRQEMEALQKQYPDIFFLWKLKALDRELETDIETLDLPDGMLQSVEELEALLPWLPRLKQLRLSSLGLSQAKLVALAEKYPRIDFIFELTFEGNVLSTDAEQIDISNTLLENTEALEALLPAFHNLKKVVMCNCGIPNEVMDALDRKYEDIRFVWSVELAGMPFRTDAVHFTPNRWGLKCTNENIADLQYCRDMICVDIGHAKAVTNCEWVRNMPNLKYLILAETGVSDLTPLQNHENLIFLELFLSKVKDLTPLTTCKALEDLNLCYTYGDPEPIGEMVWLKRLWWSGRWVARKQLPDKLTQTQMYFGGGSSTGKGWREGQHYYDMRDFIGMEYMTG